MTILNGNVPLTLRTGNTKGFAIIKSGTTVKDMEVKRG